MPFVYPFQADRVIQNVTAVAQEHKVLAWWRGSTAAHPQCPQYTERKCARPVCPRRTPKLILTVSYYQLKTTALPIIQHATQKPRSLTGEFVVSPS